MNMKNNSGEVVTGGEQKEKRQKKDMCVIDTLTSIAKELAPEADIDSTRSWLVKRRRSEIKRSQKSFDRKVDEDEKKYPEIQWPNGLFKNQQQFNAYDHHWKAMKRLDRWDIQIAFQDYFRQLSEVQGVEYDIQFQYGDIGVVSQLIDDGYLVGVMVRNHIFHIEKTGDGKFIDMSTRYSEPVSLFSRSRPREIAMDDPLREKVATADPERIQTSMRIGVVDSLKLKKGSPIPTSFWNIIAVKKT